MKGSRKYIFASVVLGVLAPMALGAGAMPSDLTMWAEIKSIVWYGAQWQTGWRWWGEIPSDGEGFMMANVIGETICKYVDTPNATCDNCECIHWEAGGQCLCYFSDNELEMDIIRTGGCGFDLWYLQPQHSTLLDNWYGYCMHRTHLPIVLRNNQ